MVGMVRIYKYFYLEADPSLLHAASDTGLSQKGNMTTVSHRHKGNVLLNNSAFLIFAVLVVWLRQCCHYRLCFKQEVFFTFITSENVR